MTKICVQMLVNFKEHDSAYINLGAYYHLSYNKLAYFISCVDND
jgi:hypothetical protein